MLRLGASLNGYQIEAADGPMGTVHDILFDDVTWKMRWLVIDFGDFLHRRRGLIHPTVIGRIDDVSRGVQVRMARATIAAAPGNLRTEPVSLQLEASLYRHYDCDPAWGNSSFSPTTIVDPQQHNADPHLRSLSAFTGAYVQALDDEVGQVESVLIDDIGWLINYLIIDVGNWWADQRVLISPHAITEIDPEADTVSLNISRARIAASPPWQPDQLVDEAYQAELHSHYDWPSH